MVLNMSKELEQKILSLLKKSQSNALALSSSLSISFESLASLIEKLYSEGLITYNKLTKSKYFYTKKGLIAQKNDLPEVALLKKLNLSNNFELDLDSLSEDEKIGINFGLKNSWFKIQNKKLILLDEGKQAIFKKTFLTLPSENDLEKLPSNTLNMLKNRGLIESKQIVFDYILNITPKGEQYLLDLSKNQKKLIKEIDRKMLLDGSWREGQLIEYNINAPVDEDLIAKRHPIEQLKQKIKKIFLSMGFKEMEGPIIEQSFWNFDALFQPQDHPARDLADTFYINKKEPILSKDLVKKIKAIHEEKWGGSWSEDLASTFVLRTHTTSLSARTLGKKKNLEPEKFFAIGKVFRNEATDYKHLAEFYQVEGIVVWEDATFANLLGILKEFYFKLGFEKIRFRPSYFPYTEPSLEIEVFDKQKNSWLELGGAGIFRPEVSLPLCGIYPVLAWGLSLERPLMLAEEIPDIRLIYKNELDWLRNFRYIK
jgi:phenylalanyl-tRNA synthetase alpha chain